MVDESLVTVTNNENPVINLEITSYNNEVDIEFVQSIESVVSVHNSNASAHPAIRAEIALKSNTSDMTAALAAKINIEEGKGLSTNDLTDSLKSNYDTAYTNNHTHTNKTTLDNIISSGDGSNYLSDDGTYKDFTTSLADVDLSNITSGAATNLNTAGVRTVVETYQSGVSWYRIWSDGWTEQGGAYSGSAQITVNLNTPFATTTYFAVAAADIYISSASYAFEYQPYNRTTTSFNVNPTSSRSYKWYACGY